MIRVDAKSVAPPPTGAHTLTPRTHARTQDEGFSEWRDAEDDEDIPGKVDCLIQCHQFFEWLDEPSEEVCALVVVCVRTHALVRVCVNESVCRVHGVWCYGTEHRRTN